MIHNQTGHFSMGLFIYPANFQSVFTAISSIRVFFTSWYTGAYSGPGHPLMALFIYFCKIMCYFCYVYTPISAPQLTLRFKHVC